jgi:hypothetical protein
MKRALALLAALLLVAGAVAPFAGLASAAGTIICDFESDTCGDSGTLVTSPVYEGDQALESGGGSITTFEGNQYSNVTIAWRQSSDTTDTVDHPIYAPKDSGSNGVGEIRLYRDTGEFSAVDSSNNNHPIGIDPVADKWYLLHARYNWTDSTWKLEVYDTDGNLLGGSGWVGFTGSEISEAGINDGYTASHTLYYDLIKANAEVYSYPSISTPTPTPTATPEPTSDATDTRTIEVVDETGGRWSPDATEVRVLESERAESWELIGQKDTNWQNRASFDTFRTGWFYRIEVINTDTAETVTTTLPYFPSGWDEPLPIVISYDDDGTPTATSPGGSINEGTTFDPIDGPTLDPINLPDDELGDTEPPEVAPVEGESPLGNATVDVQYYDGEFETTELTYRIRWAENDSVVYENSVAFDQRRGLYTDSVSTALLPSDDPSDFEVTFNATVNGTEFGGVEPVEPLNAGLGGGGGLFAGGGGGGGGGGLALPAILLLGVIGLVIYRRQQDDDPTNGGGWL